MKFKKIVVSLAVLGMFGSVMAVQVNGLLDTQGLTNSEMGEQNAVGGALSSSDGDCPTFMCACEGCGMAFVVPAAKQPAGQSLPNKIDVKLVENNGSFSLSGANFASGEYTLYFTSTKGVQYSRNITVDTSGAVDVTSLWSVASFGPKFPDR